MSVGAFLCSWIPGVRPQGKIVPQFGKLGQDRFALLPFPPMRTVVVTRAHASSHLLALVRATRVPPTRPARVRRLSIRPS